jgi:hypothetical protein
MGSPKSLRNVEKTDMQRLKKEQCSLFQVITRFAQTNCIKPYNSPFSRTALIVCSTDFPNPLTHGLNLHRKLGVLHVLSIMGFQTSLTLHYLSSQWQQKCFYTYKVSTVNSNGNEGLVLPLFQLGLLNFKA